MIRLMDAQQQIKMSLKEACRHFAHRPKVAALYRWRRNGLKNGHGEVVRLEFQIDGGRNYITLEQINRFKEAVREGR